MVFNMFKGLSRLLSRKSVKTAPVAPIVGVQSAPTWDSVETETELPELNTLYISGHPQGISIEYTIKSSTLSAIIRTHSVDVRRLRTEIVGSGGFYLPGGIGGVNCWYTDKTAGIINNSCTLPVLLTYLEREGVIRREGYQLFLGTGVELL